MFAVSDEDQKNNQETGLNYFSPLFDEQSKQAAILNDDNKVVFLLTYSLTTRRVRL